MKEQKNIPLAVVQSIGFKTRAESFDHYANAIIEASRSGASLALLPELHNQYYFAQKESSDFFSYAETIPGTTTDFYTKLAKENNIVIVTSLFEKRAKGLYHNTAVVIDKDGSIKGMYRKMHIPDDPGYYEKYYFTPGDLGFKPIETSIGKLGVLICWDQWFPEAARLMALNGADCLLYPTAIGFNPKDDTQTQQKQLNAWRLIQQSHAVANGLPVASCNRCGLELIEDALPQGIDFWGNSFITGTQGEILTSAEDKPEILYADLKLEQTEKTRQAWPYLRDRRVDYYQPLNQLNIDKNVLSLNTPSSEPL